MLSKIRITHLENVLRFSTVQQNNTQSRSAATPAARRGATKEVEQSISQLLIHELQPGISITGGPLEQFFSKLEIEILQCLTFMLWAQKSCILLFNLTTTAFLLFDLTYLNS